MKYRSKKNWGASIKGPSHILNNLPNQDSFIISKSYKGVVAVVADGLGSKRHSEKGSKQACIAVLKAIKCLEKISKKNKHTKILDIFPLIHKYWEKPLKRYGVKNCASTCLFTYITTKHILTARLGDGMIYLLGKQGNKDIVISDDKEESFSNTTISLASNNAFSRWDIKILRTNQTESIILCSDGISNDIKENAWTNFVKELRKKSLKNSRKKNIKNIKEVLLQWPVKGHSDDKTIVFIEV
ncbi:MAG: hypothetical protein CR982_05455 [Candidatus Cloacimonadota bacterium]|nr:MAG: hypothetical protein CR982_05455 [Candidatus Cloacimonadota bacterium]PIE77586.1 MAG: hypothetical protein CSA15_12170 [Candidatus Delongbacteria bacterium]